VTANITVQGQGSAPGAAQLVVNINSSDPAAQFVQKSQQLNVTIGGQAVLAYLGVRRRNEQHS
jgi:hypothetical protein